MKFITNIVLLTIISFAMFAQDSCKVKLTVNVNKNDAVVFLNGDEIGKGNISIEIERGKHELVIMQSAERWGSEVITDSIEVNNCDKPINLDYTFKQTTIVNSLPDAALFKGDSLLGYTPIQIPLTFRNLTLQKNNYRNETIQLKETSIQPKANLNYVGNGKQGAFIESTLFKVLIGSAVAFGAAAAYLKLEADKKFDKYIETRDTDYLDQTDTLDLFSGLALGALEINFGALLYFFLTE